MGIPPRHLLNVSINKDPPVVTLEDGLPMRCPGGVVVAGNLPSLLTQHLLRNTTKGTGKKGKIKNPVTNPHMHSNFLSRLYRKAIYLLIIQP